MPKGKELVHGFGIVLSLEILNKPIINQIQITDAFKFEQEIGKDVGKTQNLQLELIQLGTSQDDFDSLGSKIEDSIASSLKRTGGKFESFADMAKTILGCIGQTLLSGLFSGSGGFGGLGSSGGSGKCHWRWRSRADWRGWLGILR